MPSPLPPSIGFRLVPGNFAPMKGADLHGRAQESGCGHSLEMWLKLQGDRIAAASFVTDGCDTFQRSGSLVAHLSQGRTPAGAAALEMDEVLEALGDRSAPARHATDLALRALAEALGTPAQAG